MADFKFSCPHCSIDIECDELWSGHEIQCPSCHKEFTVPAKPSGPSAASLASAKAAQPKLSISAAHAQHVAATKPIAPQVAAYEQRLQQAKAGQKGSATKWIVIGAVVIILGVGGYFGYGYFTEWKAKRDEAAKQAAAPPPPTNAAPAQPEPPPPPKELPILPAVWTLDLAQAKIPEGKANGSITGTNFVVETAFCTPQMLGLYQGTPRSPDCALVVYLNLKPGESLTNRTFTVEPDKRDSGVRSVLKEWKTDPRYAPHTKPFSSGYLMKLELGDMTSNILSGKIYVALPDTEQSVVAGLFKATVPTMSGSPNGASVQAAQASPKASAADAAYEKRYGKKH